MAGRKPLHPPCIVACVLFLTSASIFSIIWSLIIMISLCDTLVLTGTDFINAFLLLSGIMTIPSNVHLFRCVTKNRRICCGSEVFFCNLWVNLAWCILINAIGLLVTLLRLFTSYASVPQNLILAMLQYRTSPKQKHFLDNTQWYLKCCGLHSYRDWFHYDWYDKIRDYEWDSSRDKRFPPNKQTPKYVDSVPQSCCKTGSCISNYLSELGTFFINTKGCHDPVYRFLIIYLSLHVIYFSVVIIVEVIILKFSFKKEVKHLNEVTVRHIMTVKDNFRPSSESYSVIPDESDESSIN